MRFPFFGKNDKHVEMRLAVASFVIGVGVMAVEITASRLLAPFFGASMYVWTSLIVTVLLALSFGYFLGGNVAAKGAGTEIVGYLACCAAVLLVLGMLVIPRFSGAVSLLLTGFSSATAALFLGSLFVTIIVFAAPVFLMAMAAPILLKEWSALGDVGTMSGRYFAISTGGSVVGTVAPTLVLVPWLGARNTLYAVAATFIALAFFLLPAKRRPLLALVAAALIAVALILPHNRPQGVVLERETPYQLIRVAQLDDGRRLFIFNEGSGIQSVYVPGGGKAGFYFDGIAVLPLLRPPHEGPHKALIVGLAGGTLASRYRSFVDAETAKRIEITGVEVDPAVIETAREYFGLDNYGVKVVNQDGRMFFHTTKEQFDTITVDAYSTQLYIPPHMATSEFFALTKTKLRPGGILAMNINAPSEDSRLLKALANTVAGEYKHVMVTKIGTSWNHYLLASDEPLDLAAAADRVPAEFYDVADSLINGYEVAFDPKAEVLTDDRAPTEFLTDNMILEQAWKQRR